MRPKLLIKYNWILWSGGCVVLQQLWGDTPHPRAKEKPQQVGRRGEIAFGIKPHTARDVRRAQTNLVCISTQRPHSDPQNCVWVSPMEVRISSGLPRGRGSGVQQAWVWHKPSRKRSPLTPPYNHQNLHRTGETDTWRAQTKPGYSKHPVPTTQEKTLHMDITRWSISKSDWLYSLQPKMEKIYTVSKHKTRSWLWLRPWTHCQIQT